MKYNIEFDKIVAKVQSLSPEYLADKGILNHSADGLFVCPFCQNGEGEDGTGIDFKDTGNTFISHCFKCGESFNIIHVLAHHFNLDSKSQFREVILQAAKLFNLDIPKSHSARKELKDYSSSINFAKQNLTTLLNKFGDGKSFRGLTADTLKHFQVGFNPRFTYKKTFSERVIIPTSKYHFLARALSSRLSPPTTPSRDQKIHLGPKGIFNFNQLNSANADDVFFLVEGEFDAMSVYQVGFYAIAISGSEITSNSDYGTSQLQQLKSVTVKPNIIVLLDNDHKSDNVADKLVAKLQHIGYKSAKAFLPDAFDNQPISDSNDLLQLDPAALASTLRDIADNTVCAFAPDIDEDFQDRAEQNNNRTADHFDDCPVNLFIPEGFFVKDGAIYKASKRKNDDDEFVCGTPVFIVKKLISDKGDGARLQITYRKNNTWQYFDINIADIADPRSLARVFGNHGLTLDSRGAKLLANYLVKQEHYNGGNIERELYYTQPGWHGGKFIYPGVQVIRGGFEYDETFGVNGTEEAEVDLLKEILLQSTMARIALGASAAGPLVRVLGIRNGMLHMCPGSESGKTALAQSVMSIWGNPQRLFNSFSGTLKSLLELPSYYNDLPTWVDELESADEAVVKNLRIFIMDYANGMVRARMTKESELKAKVTFKGVRITTGERSITEMAPGVNTGNGAHNRVLIMRNGDCLDRRFASRIHRYFEDEKTASYGHIGRKWVEWLADEKHQELVRKYYREISIKIKRRAAIAGGYVGATDDDSVQGLPVEVVGLSGGQIQQIALFLTGLKYLSVVAFDSAIAETVEDFIEEVDLAYFTVDYRKDQTISTAERALPEIVDDMNKHAAEFSYVDKKSNKLIAPYSGTSYGIKEEGNYGLRTKDFKELIKRGLGYPSPDEIINDFARYGLLVDDGKVGWYEHKHRVYFKDDQGNQQSEWVYMLKANALELMEQERARRVEKASAA